MRLRSESSEIAQASERLSHSIRRYMSQELLMLTQRCSLQPPGIEADAERDPVERERTVGFKLNYLT
jgi:hypothetical protein